MFREWGVPEVLLSGHHEDIRRWRRKESLRRTRELRPDLFEKIELTAEDRELLDEIDDENSG
jgi:tRNA (guanine37-N1)-methyltransferase